MPAAHSSSCAYICGEITYIKYYGTRPSLFPAIGLVAHSREKNLERLWLLRHFM